MEWESKEDQGGVITLGKNTLWERSFQKDDKTEPCICRALEMKSRARTDEKHTLIQNCRSFWYIHYSLTAIYCDLSPPLMAVKQFLILNFQHGRERWSPCLGSRQQPCHTRSVPTCNYRHAPTGLRWACVPRWRSLQYICPHVTGCASQWHVPFQPAAPSHCMDVPDSQKRAHGPMAFLCPPAPPALGARSPGSNRGCSTAGPRLWSFISSAQGSGIISHLLPLPQECREHQHRGPTQSSRGCMERGAGCRSPSLPTAGTHLQAPIRANSVNWGPWESERSVTDAESTHSLLVLKKILIFASTVFEDQSPAAISYAKHY